MQYNLTQHSQVVDNTSIGNVVLSTAQILDIIQTTTANSPALFEGDILCLDCDLGARVNIGEIRYYFSSEFSSGAVASGIEFYYKNEDFDSYISLPVTIGASYYYTTITSGIAAPRYIRVKHTVISGTAVSGTVDGFEVINEDDVVDYGTDGTRTSENFEMALLYDTEEIRPIHIFNDNDRPADAHIIVEPQGSAVDEVLSISTSQSGPWYSPVQIANMIAGTNRWDTGNYLYTEETFEQLGIVTGSGIGTYTTRIFDTLDTQKFTYLNLDTTYPESGLIVAVSFDDSQETIEIRSSNTQPMDYITYRKPFYLANGGVGSYLKYRDRSIYDNSIIHISQGTDLANTQHDYINDNYAKFHIDRNTRKCYIMFKWNHSHLYDYDHITIGRYSKNGNTEAVLDLVSDYEGYGAINIFSVLNSAQEGLWFYCYQLRSTGAFNQGTGYYLMHHDQSMTRTLRLYSDVGFIYEMDIVYDTGDLWYSDPVNYQAIKLDVDGNILATQQFTDDTRGIVATDDGGCWVIQGSKIFNLDSDGTVVDEIDLTDTATNLSRLAWDGDDALWVTDGTYVRRVLLDGRINFSVDLTFQATELQAYDTGVACFCIDRGWRFVSKADRRVIYTLENATGKNMHIGVEGASFDNLIYADEFPIDFDSYWTTLEWNTAAIDYYLMPEGKYNQIRLTLRANDVLTSPIVNGLYLNESIQLQNVPANSYKTMYMKADTTAQDESDSGAYTSNLKTWWYIPVE